MATRVGLSGGGNLILPHRTRCSFVRDVLEFVTLKKAHGRYEPLMQHIMCSFARVCRKQTASKKGNVFRCSCLRRLQYKSE